MTVKAVSIFSRSLEIGSPNGRQRVIWDQSTSWEHGTQFIPRLTSRRETRPDLWAKLNPPFATVCRKHVLSP
jgi:hypothetical protein